tara:strand:- start:1229 stop:1432 length:204 start_codon:yes stop_codon:yes gene_type:complete
MEQYKTTNMGGQVIYYEGFVAQKVVMGRTIVFKLMKGDETITHLNWDENPHDNISLVCKYIDNISKN